MTDNDQTGTEVPSPESLPKVANDGIKEAIEASGECFNPKRNGSTKALAELCGVTQPAVMHWLYRQVPAHRAVQIELITGVSREKIRPDLYPIKDSND